MATDHDSALKGTLYEMFHAAVKSADPHSALMTTLPEKPKTGKCVVIGAGKASASMAAALEAAWPDVALSGVVVTRYGHAVPTQKIRIIEAGHPVSDAMSEVASMLILEQVKNLGPEDCVIALISGGGSSLMALPRKGITLADKQTVNKALLKSGATIQEMNVVRRHLSDIKGGRLALAARPAKVVTLIISDVPGDDPQSIASGPTVPDSSHADSALEIIDRYRLVLPDHVRAVIEQPRPPVTPADIRADVRLIATPSGALQAAAEVARRLGYTPLILGDALEGEKGIWAIAGDSDGIDGTEDAAGAVITPDTLQRAQQAGLNARDHLAQYDSYSYFAALEDLVKTGPTLTNVNDIRAIVIE